MNLSNDVTRRDWAPGMVVAGSYVLTEGMGDDGVTSIYGVEAAATGDRGLLSALNAGLTDEPAMARAFRETCELVRRISHPNLPAVEATGEAEGRPFVVTRGSAGQTLEDLLQAEGRLSPARACAIASQIAAALEAAHRLGLLHLGLEPRHIAVTESAGQDRVTVLGLGVARLRMIRSRRVLSAAAGTDRPLSVRDLMPLAPEYCAPEVVLSASPENLDGRADLYSLGVMTYRMVMGRLPASDRAPDGEDLGVLAAQVEQSPSPLEFEPSIPASLACLVQQLLENRRELRPSTAKVVNKALELAAGTAAAKASRQSADSRQNTPALAQPVAQPVPLPATMPASLELAHAVADEVASGPSAPVSLPEPTPTPSADPSIAARPVEGFSELPLEARLSPEPAAPLVLRPGGRLVGEMPAVGAGPLGPPADDVPDLVPFGSPTSVLFKTGPAAGPPTGWGRKAAAALVVVLMGAAAVFFIGESKKLQWGSLTPTTVDEQHSLSRPDATAAAGPSATSPSNATPTSVPDTAPAQSQPERPTPTVSDLPGKAAGGQNAMTSPGATVQVPKANAQQASDADAAAEIQRAISAGDVFYQTGQYDLAIQAYQGPLQDHPKNQLLRSRIERARKAKAAEQEYLGP